MIKHNIEKHTIGWMKAQDDRGNLDFSISIQRKEVWDEEHQSNLICSLLIGIPVESILFEEDEFKDGAYKVLDGKQRSTTILHYLNDEFPISEKSKIHEINGVDVVGKRYSELPEDLQLDLKEYELSIAVVRALTEDEREVLFFMRNQAVPLTKLELAKVLMGSAVMDALNNFVQHPFMKKVNLTESALKRSVDQEVVMHCLILETGKDLSFSGKDVMGFAETLREESISLEVQEQFIKIFDYLDKAIPEPNKSLRKTHIPMLYSTVKTAMELGIKEDSFGEWVNMFFKHIKKPNRYSDACSAGSSKKSNIQARLAYMQDYFVENIERA